MEERLKVYLIRHGQTTDNAAGIHQGWNDVTLSERGIRQAENAHKMMEKIPIDYIYCSDLPRTMQTCSIVFPGREDVLYDARVREINNTVLSGRSYAEMEALYGDAHAVRRSRFDFSDYGGESGTHLYNRAYTFLKSLESIDRDKRVAVVTHAGVIHAIGCVVLGIPPTARFSIVENASVSELLYDGSHWRIATWNRKLNLS